MNTEAEYRQNVLPKIEGGYKLSMHDAAVHFDNNPDFLFGFLADNDPKQLNALIHHSDAPGTVGRGMKFFPDAKKSYGELKLLYAKRDYKTLNDIINNFRVNMNPSNYTTNPNFLKALENIRAVEMKGASALGSAGYGFTQQF